MNKILKNWSYLLFSDISQAIMSFIVFIFLARMMAPEEYGSLNALLALVALFSTFAIQSSSSKVLIREVTLKPKTTSSIFRTVFIIRTISFIIAITGLIIYSIWGNLNASNYLPWLVIIILSNLIWDLSESIAFGHFVTKFTTIISMGASVIWLGTIMILPEDNITVYIIIKLYACVFLLRGLMYMAISYKKFISTNNEPSLISFRNILLMSAPFFWMRMIGTFGDQIPILLLEKNSNSEEVAFFAVGYKFVFPIIIAVTTGMRALFPFMTKLYNENREKFNDKTLQGFTFILVLGSILAALLTLTSIIWLPFLFGNSYLQATVAFNYQAWLGVLLCMDLLLAAMLSSSYRQNILAFITTIDVLIIFPLLYLGSFYGAEGMALLKLLAMIITSIFHVIIMVKKINLNLNSKEFLTAGVLFITLMASSIFIQIILLKTIIIFVIIITYTIVNKSYIGNIYLLIKNKLNTNN